MCEIMKNSWGEESMCVGREEGNVGGERIVWGEGGREEEEEGGVK